MFTALFDLLIENGLFLRICFLDVFMYKGGYMVKVFTPARLHANIFFMKKEVSCHKFNNFPRGPDGLHREAVHIGFEVDREEVVRTDSSSSDTP